MSTGEEIWHLIGKLATELDGDRESSEQVLDELESELRILPRGARDETRRNMIQIVAALSRLEVRLIDAYGPLRSAV